MLKDNFEQIFNSMNEGILIIDTECKIKFVNDSYLNFIKKTKHDVLDKPLKDIRHGARLPEVFKTKTPILHVTREENDNNDVYFVNMYPIFDNETIIGGISIVTFKNDAFDFKSELDYYEKYSKRLLRRISKATTTQYTFDSIIANDDKSVEVKKLAKRVARTEAPVLLSSESGTGKEMYAQAIHNASLRSNEVFVAINCANFNNQMLESELFGYVEGSFTGAKKGGKIGLFEAANGGTIFLDEISEMDISLQSKLLRVLQERKVRPIGSIVEIPIDVRIISASNANLVEYIDNGKFRMDLYYRLSTFVITIPPLRQRKGDIQALCKSILGELEIKLKHSLSVDEEALKCLMTHEWPGNVRELRNVLEFSSFISDDGVITLETLPNTISRKYTMPKASLNERVKAFEKREIEDLLTKYGDSIAGKKTVCKELGISLATLYNKIGKF